MSQKYSPYEIGLGRMVDLKKEYFIGREALAAEHHRGPKRLLMGLDVHWEDVERLYDAVGLGPQVPSTASRSAVPVYRGGLQVGKATSTTWSPTLKKMIALASMTREHAASRHRTANGTDRRSRTSQGEGDGQRIAVFQSAEKDGHAGNVKIPS